MKKIAVLIPCYNEEKTIGQVIDSFHQYCPQADVYVYDNNSTDKTVEIAQQHGAIVHHEPKQGKGNVVRRMFADVEADIYVMTDGDSTYDISRVPEMLKLLEAEQLDMVVGTRQETQTACYRSGHRFGNRLLNALVQTFFHASVKDMLSGLRVFSKRFIKTFPAQSGGFEIETELTIYTLSEKLPMKEIDTKYFARPEGSKSKLSTYRDGMRILHTIIWLVKDERPMLFFSIIAAILFSLSIVLAIPLMVEFLRSGLVPRFPTAILVTGIMICAVLSLLVGCILDSVANFRKENRRQKYLAMR